MSFRAHAKRLHRAGEMNSAYRVVTVSKGYVLPAASSARNAQAHSIVVKGGAWSRAIVSVMRNASWDVYVMMTYFAPIYVQLNYPVWVRSAVDQLVNVWSRGPV